MVGWPSSAVRDLRRALAAVERAVRDAPPLATAGPEDPGADRYAVDRASRLRHDAGELRTAVDRVPWYGLLRRLFGLPERRALEAAAHTLDAMAESLLTDRAAEHDERRLQVARLLGRAAPRPSADRPPGEPPRPGRRWMR